MPPWQALGTCGQSWAPSLFTCLVWVVTWKGKLLTHHSQTGGAQVQVSSPFYVQYSTCRPERNWDFAKLLFSICHLGHHSYIVYGE